VGSSGIITGSEQVREFLAARPDPGLPPAAAGGGKK